MQTTQPSLHIWRLYLVIKAATVVAHGNCHLIWNQSPSEKSRNLVGTLEITHRQIKKIIVMIMIMKPKKTRKKCPILILLLNQCMNSLPSGCPCLWCIHTVYSCTVITKLPRTPSLALKEKQHGMLNQRRSSFMYSLCFRFYCCKTPTTRKWAKLWYQVSYRHSTHL